MSLLSKMNKENKIKRKDLKKFKKKSKRLKKQKTKELKKEQKLKGKEEKRNFKKEIKKGEKFIFFRILCFLFFFFVINMFLFFYRVGGFARGVTGLAVKEIPKEYSSLSSISKTFLIGQWALLILLLAYSFIKDKNLVSRKKELIGIDIKKMSKNSKTDLDTLYNILKMKKQLRASSIAKIFNVNINVAIEWGKILESGNLAIMEYGSTKDPTIKIINKYLV